MGQRDTVNPQPLRAPTEPAVDPIAPAPERPLEGRSWGWSTDLFETREVRKARERADRAARRASRAARRVQEAEDRAAGRRSSARQLVDAAGDAATAALTAVSAAAEEAHARLEAKARMRELEHAVVTARAGGAVDVSTPTIDEAMKLADRLDPGSSSASFVRGIGFIVAGLMAFAMTTVGSFGWLGFVVPLAILVGAASVGNRIDVADRRWKAGRIQFELARASLAAPRRAGDPATPGPGLRVPPGSAVEGQAVTAANTSQRRRLIEDGDPRTSADVLAVLDRLVAKMDGVLSETDMGTLRRIRHDAALALPPTDGPLDLTDHDTWLLRQTCINYLPGALEHYLALPSDLASEPVLDGRSAQQVLDEQLALIETRVQEMATRSFRREANGLLTHGRFVADSLRPDPFHAIVADLVTSEAEPAVRTREPA
jgi:hypothetical protein